MRSLRQRSQSSLRTAGNTEGLPIVLVSLEVEFGLSRPKNLSFRWGAWISCLDGIGTEVSFLRKRESNEVVVADGLGLWLEC